MRKASNIANLVGRIMFIVKCGEGLGSDTVGDWLKYEKTSELKNLQLIFDSVGG
ncbi:MAG: hypothetical protein IID12_07870 [Candidatus Marinimicrobia bacterium]|nr:hypothetical protein [Candidatus Neomarinimicrobiota bacterium]